MSKLPALESTNCGIEVEPGHICFLPEIVGYPPGSLILSPETAASMSSQLLPNSVRIFPLDSVARRELAIEAGVSLSQAQTIH